MKVEGLLSLTRLYNGEVLIVIEDPHAKAIATSIVMTEKQLLNAFIFGESQVGCRIEIPEFEKLGKKFEEKLIHYPKISRFPDKTDRAIDFLKDIVAKDNVDGWIADLDRYTAERGYSGKWVIAVPFVRYKTVCEANCTCVCCKENDKMDVN